MAGQRGHRHELHTDSAHRFERGVDPELPLAALERATALITGICGGEPGRALSIASSATRCRRARRFTLRRQPPRARCSDPRPARRQARGMLERLGLQVEASAEGWHARPPSWRYDLAIEADLVEEVARLHGYNRHRRARTTAAAHGAAPATGDVGAVDSELRATRWSSAATPRP
ncbi:MAG: phenylalanine--tRNA ligase beta subunit-related protein [Halofilum sp. (in: g-proteobacteria)]|nr:phenylalanine--tRNA ligase beta subunit-related protein [Halofilum sp. (in: g-proteobacteria)]